MNRRQFLTSTALALPSLAVFGAISTQPKTYRSADSLYSTEELNNLCEKYGMYYANGDEVLKSAEYVTDACYTHTKKGFNIDRSLVDIRNHNKNDKIVILDILAPSKLDQTFITQCIYIHYIIVSKDYKDYMSLHTDFGK